MKMIAKLVADNITGRAYNEFELNSLSAEILDRYEEITLLYNIGETLGTVFDAPTINKIVLEKVTEVIGAQKAWIIIRDEKNQTLSLTAAKGLSKDEIKAIGFRSSDQLYKILRAIVNGYRTQIDQRIMSTCGSYPIYFKIG